MADVTEVIHKISYEVNDEALNNATRAIQVQIDELNRLNKSLNDYSQQLGKLTANQSSQIEKLGKSIESTNNAILNSLNKTEGLVSELFKGIVGGLTGSDSLKSAVSKYVSSVTKEFKSLESAGKQTSIGFAKYMKDASNAGTKASGGLKASFKNLTTSMLSSVNVTGLAVNALFALGQELLKEGGILDSFIHKQKEAVSETQRISEEYANITSRAAELAAEELANAEILYDVATDVTASYDSRIEAVNKLQETYPALFANMTQEAILAGKAVEQYEKLKEAIVAKASIEVYKDQLKELIKERSKLEPIDLPASKSAKDNDDLNNLLNSSKDASEFSQGDPIGKKGAKRSDINPLPNGSTDQTSNSSSGIRKQLEASYEHGKFEAEKIAKLKAENEAAIQRVVRKMQEAESIINNALPKKEVGGGVSRRRTNTSTKKTEETGQRAEPRTQETLEPLKTSAELKRENALASKEVEEVELPSPTLPEKDFEEKLDRVKETYKELGDVVQEVANNMYEAQIESLDKEIAYRKENVTKAQKLAERGNVEILRYEEERLRKAEQARALAAKKQQQVNAALQASNAAVALTEAIVAVSKAAAGGDPYTVIARVVAAVGSLIAGVSSLKNAFGSTATESFADGVVDYKGIGGPRDDKNWVRISSGESVITAEGTQRNKKLLEAINNGAAMRMIDPSLPFLMPTFQQPTIAGAHQFASNTEVKQLAHKLDDVVHAIEDSRLRQNIYFNEEGVGMMTERAIRKNKRRFK